MAAPSPQQVTQLLEAWGHGDQKALDQLIPVIYQELHRVAHRFVGLERSDRPLQTTELVNEAYLRLVRAQQVPWQNRTHFLAIAARLMRQVLVDHARARYSQKGGGAAQHIPLDEKFELSKEKSAELSALDDALKALAVFDERKSQVVELRFFGGLTIEETAEVLKVSPDTIMRDWNVARLWLYRELSQTKNQMAIRNLLPFEDGEAKNIKE